MNKPTSIACTNASSSLLETIPDIPLVALERMVPPEIIDGRHGLNRYVGTCHIVAETDLEAINCFLAQYRDNKHTYRVFRREVERLYLWCLSEAKKPLSSIDGADLIAFRDFLIKPKGNWCSGAGKPCLRGRDEWRPLKGPLKATSVVTAMSTIRPLFTFLIESGYLISSPLLDREVSRVLKKAATAHSILEKSHQNDRILKGESLAILIRHVNNMPEDYLNQRYKKKRLMFILEFGLYLAPSISEMANAKMCDFHLGRDNKWWWRVERKRKRLSHIPISQEMLIAINEWKNAIISKVTRQSPPDGGCLVDGLTPVLRRLDGVTAMGAPALYQIVTALARDASVDLSEESVEYQQLQSLSPDWLRHTADRASALSITDHNDA